MYDRAAMAGPVVFGVLAVLVVAGCHDRNQGGGGCAGAAVIITVTPSPATDGGADAASPGDGGGADAKPACTGKCDEYLEALRVAIEAATPAVCLREPLSYDLACAPSPNSPAACPSDTIDAATSLEAQIRDYLMASWPEIDQADVVLDTCTCHAN